MSLVKGFALTCLGGFSAILGFAFAADTYSFGKNVMSNTRTTRDKIESGFLVLCTSILGGLVASLLFTASFKFIEAADSMID